MNTTSARQAILDRVRAATHGTAKEPYSEIPRDYIRHGSLEPAPLCELMLTRLREYGAEVAESTSEKLSTVIAQQLQSTGRRNFLAPPGVPAEWLTSGFDWKIDRGLSHEEIERCDGVITGAFAGIAESGTIVLHHSPAEGRRVISLLPDWHLCILFAGQLVETLPEYFDLCQQPPRLATYIAGPSATADIEMTRIKGVHGPRFLNVILVHSES